MRLTIACEIPTSPDGCALVAESQAALEEIYPPEEIFSLAPAALAKASAAFLVARDGAGKAQGCVALVDAGDYGEIKRLYVRPAGRGRGVARALMAALEDEARRRSLPEILLETGDKLVAALGLYQSLGYAPRGAFGSYTCHAASLFMGKRLA